MEFKPKALNNEKIEKVHELTLQILEKYGIKLDNDDSLTIFKKHGAIIDGKNVKIPRTIVENALKTVPKEFELKARNATNNVKIGPNHSTLIAPSVGVLNVVNSENIRVRASIDDLSNFLKLSHTSSHCGISCAGLVYPDSSDPQRILYEQLMEAIKTSDKALMGIADNKKISEASIAMAKLSTEFDEGHYVLAGVNSLSPLSWDENMLDSIKVFAENNQPLMISCCSMAGFTSHITLEGTLVSNNVEILAGIVYSQLVNPGTPVIYGCTSTVSDMRTVGIAIGAPETGMLSTAACQLARFYEIPCRSGGGLSDSKDLDVQAGIESATNLLLTVGNNIDFALFSLGIQESFNSISYQKWIIDEEILDRIYTMKKKMNNFDDTLVDIIGQAGNDNYLQHPDTMKNFRDAFFLPKIADRNNYRTWVDRGIDAKVKANEIVNKRLNSYIEPKLDSSINKALLKYIETL
jgi:trimethylamine--corrinoid protein Co-methyltransferase